MTTPAQNALKQDSSMQDTVKIPSGNLNMTAAMQDALVQDSSKQDASRQDDMQPPSSPQIKSSTHFLVLPAEIRNRIYRLLFSGTTIHLDGTAANPTNTYTLCISTGTAPLTDYLTTKNLAGASQATIHSINGTTTVTTRDTEGEVCDSNQVLVSNHICREHVQLSTQMLRVNRQIHSEAALLPYATNAFMFSGGMGNRFRTAFAKQSNEKQRHAMRIVIVPSELYGHLSHLSRHVPDVKFLWVETPAPRRKDEDKDEET